MDAATGAAVAAAAVTFVKSLISLQVLKRLLSLLVVTWFHWELADCEEVLESVEVK